MGFTEANLTKFDTPVSNTARIGNCAIWVNGGAYAGWASADIGNTPAIGLEDFICIFRYRRASATPGNQRLWHFTIGYDNSNYLAFATHNNTNPGFGHTLRVRSGASNIVDLVNDGDDALHTACTFYIAYRCSGEYGVGRLQEVATGDDETSYFSITKDTLTRDADDLTAITTNAASRCRINGIPDTGPEQFEYAYNAVTLALGTAEDSMAVPTDAELIDLCLNPQWIFGYDGVDTTTPKVYSFGDVATAASAVSNVKFPTDIPVGYKLVCPNTSYELVLAQDGAATQQPKYYQPYAAVAGSRDGSVANTLDSMGPQTNPGSANPNYCPVHETNQDTFAFGYHTDKDSTDNKPEAWLSIIGLNGLMDRLPIPMPARYRYADASASYALVDGNQYVHPTAGEAIGDTHTSVTCLVDYDTGQLFYTIAPHSDIKEVNQPDTNDILLWPPAFLTINDSGTTHTFGHKWVPVTVQGDASDSDSYNEFRWTYNSMALITGADGIKYVLLQYRQRGETSGRYVCAQFNVNTRATARQTITKVVTLADLWGISTGSQVLPLTDGYFFTHWRPKGDAGEGGAGLWGVIGRVGADFTNSSEWYAPLTGEPLDGSGTNSLTLGSLDPGSPEFYIDGINDTELRAASPDQTVMDRVFGRNSCAILVNGIRYLIVNYHVSEGDMDNTSFTRDQVWMDVFVWSPGAKKLVRQHHISLQSFFDQFYRNNDLAQTGHLWIQPTGRTDSEVLVIDSFTTDAEPDLGSEDGSVGLAFRASDRVVQAWVVPDPVNNPRKWYALDDPVQVPDADTITNDGGISFMGCGSGAEVDANDSIAIQHAIHKTSNTNYQIYPNVVTPTLPTIATADPIIVGEDATTETTDPVAPRLSLVLKRLRNKGLFATMHGAMQVGEDLVLSLDFKQDILSTGDQSVTIGSVTSLEIQDGVSGGLTLATVETIDTRVKFRVIANSVNTDGAFYTVRCKVTYTNAGTAEGDLRIRVVAA